jgi:hypothetical protein
MRESQSDRQRRDQEDCERMMDRTRYQKKDGFFSWLGCSVLVLVGVSGLVGSVVEIVQHIS